MKTFQQFKEDMTSVQDTMKGFANTMMPQMKISEHDIQMLRDWCVKGVFVADDEVVIPWGGELGDLPAHLVQANDNLPCFLSRRGCKSVHVGVGGG